MLTYLREICSSTIMIAMALKQWFCNKETSVNSTISSYCSSESGGHSKHPSLESFLLQKEPENVLEYTSQDVFMAIGKLGLIMGYFFLCDRYYFTFIFK